MRRRLSLLLLCLGCKHQIGAELSFSKVADIALPGGSTRFDYQDLDDDHGRLVLAHMNDDSVDVVDLASGELVAEIADIPTARGVVVAEEVDRVFVTSSPDQLVILDSDTLSELGRVTTGRSPDGVGWDPDHEVVGVSDQRDGAISLIAEAGDGARTQVALGDATGNVVYDASRGWFWIAVEQSGDDQLVAVDPVAATVQRSLDLPGCDSAHGVRVAPDAKSAFVACEGDDMLARVDLDTGALSLGDTSAGPDVLSVDPGLGWLYVAAEGGDTVVYDIDAPGVSVLGHLSVGDNAHSVGVDPATHEVYFPLESGDDGAPVLRVMAPEGT